MNIILKQATLELAPSFWSALDTVARERRYLIFTEAPPLEKTLAFVTEIIEKGWSQYYAIHDDRVIGWCDVVRKERSGLTHSGILGVGILPEFRKQGLGRRLMTTTIEDAFSKGLQRIELEVFASNKRAAHLYRKLGFVEEGRKIKARYLDGVYDDFILMALIKNNSE